MSLSGIPRALRETIYHRDAGRCRYCQLRQHGQGAVFHINHVIPRRHGGPTTEDNLVLQCPYCSLHKSDKLSAADPEGIEIVALFHPLLQHWADHFSLLDDGTIAGRSATGRATIVALRMNDSIPKTARLLQLILFGREA